MMLLLSSSDSLQAVSDISWQQDKVMIMQWVMGGLLAAVLGMIIFIFKERDSALKKNTAAINSLTKQQEQNATTLSEHIKSDTKAFDEIHKKLNEVKGLTNKQTQDILTGVKALLEK